MTGTHLRDALMRAADKLGSQNAATVLARQNDPFRLDTPANHRDGAWLANTADELGLGNRTVHLRGLHYMLIGMPKPNGEPYTNTQSDWLWLSGTAGKAARWLGYLPWDQVVDQRNAPPTIVEHEPCEPEPYLHVGLHVSIPSADDIEPIVSMTGVVARQPYRLVMFGEKSSLEPVLAPIARSYGADLYLPTGEISDTLMHTMARNGADDGRPMVVLCFSDADPAGWQMPISIGRKLQAFTTNLYPQLDWQVRRVALTPDQVREHGLPSTPLKPTERRADRWLGAMGVEQTEIDALAALNPELLRRIATDAVLPFVDDTLEARTNEAVDDWEQDAQEIVNQQVNGAMLDQLRVQAEDKLDELRAEIQAINSSIRLHTDDIHLLPSIDLPDPVVFLPDDPPLVDSRWSFVAQTASLIESKNYAGGGA